MSLRTSDVVPISEARARLTELAEEVVGDVTADEREEVARRNEQRHERARVGLVHAEALGHVQRENGAHAVVRAALGKFAPEEEAEPDRVCRRNGCGIGRHVWNLSVC